MKQVFATVISNEIILSRDHHHAGRELPCNLITLQCPEVAAEAKPGQFVMVRCGEETTLPRPLSIHRQKNDSITLLVNVSGKGTAWLTRRQPGENVRIFGPLGNGFSLSPDSRNLLLVAGGIGIAPLCFLAEKAVDNGLSVTILCGTAETPSFVPALDGAGMIAATEDGSTGHHGMVTDLLPEYVPLADQVFACGPLPMYQTMAQMPELKGKDVQVSLEVRMACGRGVCYGCSVKTRQGQKKVCSDGPVFNMDDIIWDDLVLL